MKLNGNLRFKAAKIIHQANEGHIPSGYSIIEILNVLYGKFLTYKKNNPNWSGRDYFILSKGHGCAALYVVLNKYGLLSDKHLKVKGSLHAILGGHPDSTKIPFVEASTGSLGHGVVTAMGIALGLRIRKQKNKVIALIGDGESNEGTVWEMALVAAHQKLGNFCVIVDNNGSTEQILSMPNIKDKWQAFGWDAAVIDGHNEKEILETLKSTDFNASGKPHVIIANTIKGKGVSFMEGHGVWHHKIPTVEEMDIIKKELFS